jgi:DNA invertase Pin-like site-specific DNA recombinase
MSNKAIERAFIYCRQSKTDGDGERSISLASQERMLRDLCEERGLVIVGVEVDADVRGWRDERDRPGLRRTLDRAAAGEYDALVFYDISRVARDVFLLERLVRDLGRHGVRPISLKEPQIEEPFYRQILAAIAEKYTRDLAAHASRGLAERTRRGLAHGPAPLGFVKLDGRLVVDPERAPIVREMFERFVSHGKTLTEITVDLAERGIRNARGQAFSVSGVAAMLANVAYVGTVQTGETTAERAHEPIVARDTFDRAQALLAPKRRHRRKRKDEASWLEGFVFHECGRRAYLVIEKARSSYFRCRHHAERRHRYAAGNAACECRPKSKRAVDLEAEVWSTVVADLLARLPPDAAVAEAHRRYAARAPGADRARREVDRALGKLDAQFARAEALYLDGARSRAWLNDREAEIAGERALLMARLELLPPAPNDQAIRDAAAIVEIIGRLGEDGALAEMPDEQRRQIMARLGLASYGPSGVLVWYAPEIAALIPGARSFSDDTLTTTEPVPGSLLLTSLREAFESNWRNMAAIQAA